MKRDDMISEELKTIAPGLAELGAVHPQSAPEGYFDVLPSVIMSRIREEQAVPAGYFNGLAAKVMGRIKGSAGTEAQEETKELAPTLAGLSRQMPQSVPVGYFDTLADELASQRRKPAQVVTMRSFRVIRYAAAAALTGLLFLGAWMFFHNDRSIPDQAPVASVESRADSVPESALSNFLEQTGSLDDLNTDINDTAKPEDMALLNLDDQRLGEMLSTMSDKELKDFVNSDPNGVPNVMEN